jgi:hypothetical protein
MQFKQLPCRKSRKARGSFPNEIFFNQDRTLSRGEGLNLPMIFRRIIHLTMALLMAVPACGCCLSQSLAADSPSAENCMACHQFLLPEDQPAHEQESGTDCPCCLDMLERTLTPESVSLTIQSAPLLQPLVVWPDLYLHGNLCQTVRLDVQPSWNHPPRSSAVPRYHQFCTLLL